MTAGRLAPTPSGHLHLGNICAFTAAWLSVRQAGGRLLYRLEDVNRGRSRPEIAESQRHDLRWLGLDWDEEVPAQSTRDYTETLSRLPTYRCTCTRKELKAQGGTCDCPDKGHDTGAVRFHMPSGPVHFVDRRFGERTVDPRDRYGDPALITRDGMIGYNLAVVADDIDDGITEVVRGADLLDYTAVQICLYDALGVAPPTWLHAPLILGPDERKLSKSHQSTEIRAMRADGAEPADIFARVLPWLGLEGFSLQEAVDAFQADGGPMGPIVVDE